MTSPDSAPFDVELVEVDPTAAEAATSMSAYFAELDVRFPDGFDPGDALAHAAESFTRPVGAFVVGRRGGRTGDVVACGGVQLIEPDLAEIKRMWVADDARGLGLGRRLLARLEAVGAELGARRIVLDTNGTLEVAISMYRRAGYTDVERYNDNPYASHWFAKSLAT